MKKKISLKKQICLLKEQLKRAMADYQNLEKRIRKETEVLSREKVFRLADKLIGVLDNLERAEKHLKDQGLNMAVDQFKKVLESEEIEEIETTGKRFNPEIMDCVAVVSGPKEIVVETVAKGYSLKGNLIRPAKVKVGGGEEKGGQK